MGTEIRTFYSLKEINDYAVEEINEYKALSEDYSQWLGSLLRACEENHKNEDWFQKSAALQKSARAAPKTVGDRRSSKVGAQGKGKKNESSCWIQSGEVLLCSTDQGEAEILFEAIADITRKVQHLEKFKLSIQQLERIGLGKAVNYIIYIKDDVPERVVLRSKSGSEAVENFEFAADFSAPGLPT
jgi:predicted YcjX-like family ATPase